MKISEMSTEQGFDVMQKLTPYVNEIVTDEEVAKIAAEFREKKNTVESMNRLFPLMMQNHREALYGMVAAVSGKTVEQVRKQPLGKTKEGFQEAMSDDVFDFFILFLRMAVRG